VPVTYPSISLKAARVNAEFAQKEAAERLGISAATLQNYEKGNTVPDIIMTKKIERLYGYPADYIFFGRRNALSVTIK
jgi:transcriptional regulator with XRE-family HTH domain